MEQIIETPKESITGGKRAAEEHRRPKLSHFLNWLSEEAGPALEEGQTEGFLVVDADGMAHPRYYVVTDASGTNYPL